MFGLRMLAVKKSMNRSAARSPASAIIAGTGILVAGSMMVSAWVLSRRQSSSPELVICPPPPSVAQLYHKGSYGALFVAEG